ncbi:4-hydroxythreonine-4-phosphate dehydrogenase PdxA [Bacillus sp. EB106-08-02-XG196]|nr:4-hydroxythreonine-4-phosphate dehydrogenase PdxA [Bacillus sp. EB106-08-02-XG196]
MGGIKANLRRKYVYRCFTIRSTNNSLRGRVIGDNGVGLVDHGTAFDVAGKGIASEESFVEAIRHAIEIAPKR